METQLQPSNTQGAGIHSPLKLPCGLFLSNRIAKAALTECIAHPVTHAPNDSHVNLYRNWKNQSGAGMIITGNVQIDSRYKEAPGNVAIECEKDLEKLKEWAKEGQSDKTKLIVQISHAGRQCPVSVTYEPIGPSDVAAVKMDLPLFGKPRAMTADDITDVIRRFTRTATIVQKAGFAGVEIHSAHGYLLSQFLSPLTNKRTDQFGGSLDNRKRLLFEVLRSVRTAVGPAFAVGVKLNSADFQRGGFTEEESTQVIEELLADKQIALDFLEISGGCYEQSAMMTGTADNKGSRTSAREAYFLDFAEKVRKLVFHSNSKLSNGNGATTAANGNGHATNGHTNGVALMLTGGFRSATVVMDALQRGIVDIVGMGRPFIMQPQRVKELIELSAKQDVEALKGFHFVDANLKTGVPETEAGLQNLWHQYQMIRISENKAPDYNMTFVWALTVRTFATYVMDWRSASISSKLKLVAFLGTLTTVFVGVPAMIGRVVLKFFL